MGDQHGHTTGFEASTEEVKKRPKPRPPSRKGKGATPGSWKPGRTGNPNGRPRAGLAFAERVRERVDPDLVIELALRVAQDEKLSPAERLHALWPLIDRGYVKPPAGLELNVTAATGAPSFAHLSDAEVVAELERLDRLALPATHGAACESSAIDGRGDK